MMTSKSSNRMMLSAKDSGVPPKGYFWFTGQESNFDWENCGIPCNEEMEKYNTPKWPDNLPPGSIFALYVTKTRIRFVLVSGFDTTFTNAPLQFIMWSRRGYTTEDDVQSKARDLCANSQSDMSISTLEQADWLPALPSSYKHFIEKKLDLYEYAGLVRYGWVEPTYSEEANDMAKRVREDRDRVNKELSESGDDDFQMLSSVSKKTTWIAEYVYGRLGKNGYKDPYKWIRNIYIDDPSLLDAKNKRSPLGIKVDINTAEFYANNPYAITGDDLMRYSENSLDSRYMIASKYIEEILVDYNSRDISIDIPDSNSICADMLMLSKSNCFEKTVEHVCCKNGITPKDYIDILIKVDGGNNV